MKRGILISGVFLLLGAGVAWHYGQSAYHRRQERAWVNMAGAFLQKGQSQAAVLLVDKVLKRNPNNLPACRLRVRLAEINHSPDTVFWCQRLVEMEPTLGHQLALASAALRAEPPPFPTATKVLETLSPSAQHQVGYHLVAAERALRLNLARDAEEHLQEAQRLEPGNPLHSLNLAVLRLSSKDAPCAAEAKKSLLGMTNDARVAAAALRSLVADAAGQGHGQEAIELSDRLLVLPGAAWGDRLQHLSLLAASQNPGFTAYLASLQKDAAHRAAASGEVAAWLNAHGLAAETSRWLETLPSELRREPPLPLLLADAYMLQKDWPRLQASLPKQVWNGQEFIRLAMLARAAQGAGDEALAKSYWNRAARSADKETGLLDLAKLAHSWGWTNEVEQLLWQTANKYPAQRWPLQALERNYYQSGNTRGLLRVYLATWQQHPQDSIAKNDLATVCLLLRTNLVRAHSLAREAWSADSSNPLIASTYAFSLYLQGKPEEGLRILEPIGTEQRKQPSMAACYAVLLAAAGKPDQAKDYRALAERGLLLPEERALLRD